MQIKTVGGIWTRIVRVEGEIANHLTNTSAFNVVCGPEI